MIEDAVGEEFRKFGRFATVTDAMEKHPKIYIGYVLNKETGEYVPKAWLDSVKTGYLAKVTRAIRKLLNFRHQ